MTSYLTPEFVKKALSATAWDFGNRVLYDLCAANPSHTQDDIIIAKIWLIGRSYAAAIERRRSDAEVVGDAFYEGVVAPTIRRSAIDKWFSAVSASSNDDIALSLETHVRVMRLFEEVSGLEKRSLASKYLHFHFPGRFHIYDSRADKAISKLTNPIGRNLPSLREHDNVYSRFFLRCQGLNQQIATLMGRYLSPRELDKVLLAVASHS